MLLRVLATVCALVLGHAVNAASWDDTLAEARGQTVYWHAWGGDPQINAYIEWVGDQVEARHGIDLVHVKLTDTAEAVARVVAEKGRRHTEGRGRPDLDQRRELRLDEGAGSAVRPVREDLPNFRYVDTKGKPTTLVDFTVPTDGLEAPRGMAQFVLLYDTATIAEPPRSIPPCSNGSRTIPDASPIGAADFIGSTFEARADRADRPARGAPAPRGSGRLRRGDRAALGLARGGASPSLAQGRKLSAVRPGAPSAAGRWRGRLLPGVQSGRSVGGDHAGRLPETVRTFILEDGTIGNTHFVAIPFNAAHPPAPWWSPTS